MEATLPIPRMKIPSWFDTYFSGNNDTMLIFPSESNPGLGENQDFCGKLNLIGVSLDTGAISEDTTLTGIGNYELEFLFDEDSISYL